MLLLIGKIIFVILTVIGLLMIATAGIILWTAIITCTMQCTKQAIKDKKKEKAEDEHIAI